MVGLSAKNQNLVLNSINQVRNIEEDFIGRLADVERKLTSSFQKLLNQGVNVGVVDVALNRQQVQRILMDSGYFQTTSELLDNGYQDVLEESFKQYNELYGETFQFADASLQEINALKQLDFSNFNQLGQTSGEAMNRILTEFQFGNIDFNQAVDMFTDQAGRLANYSKTWVNTGIQGVYSKANTLLAEDNGITEFQYVGPRDIKTRPFCAKYIFQIKTKDEWDELNDEQGQIAPVSTFRGGYNCRHQLVGIK